MPRNGDPVPIVGLQALSTTLLTMLTITEGTSINPITKILPVKKGPVNVVLSGELRRDLSRIAMSSFHSMSSLIAAILEEAMRSNVNVIYEDGSSQVL